MIPPWLHALSLAMLTLGLGCALLIAADEIRHPQHMPIMNVVWPVAALFGTVLWLCGYVAWGRAATKEAMHRAMERDHAPTGNGQTPFWGMVFKGASHCGAGCTLGDICAEWLCFLVPAVAIWFGWHSLFSERMFAVWVVDFVVAYAFGIVFQYFAIKPMRDLSVADGIWQAIKADTLSLASWQVGMYGFMAFASFYLFGTLLGVRLEPDMPEFWFMMQLAMLCGFATAYPVNWWLISSGIKERM